LVIYVLERLDHHISVIVVGIHMTRLLGCSQQSHTEARALCTSSPNSLCMLAKDFGFLAEGVPYIYSIAERKRCGSEERRYPQPHLLHLPLLPSLAVADAPNPSWPTAVADPGVPDDGHGAALAPAAPLRGLAAFLRLSQPRVSGPVAAVPRWRLQQRDQKAP